MYGSKGNIHNVYMYIDDNILENEVDIGTGHEFLSLFGLEIGTQMLNLNSKYYLNYGPYSLYKKVEIDLDGIIKNSYGIETNVDNGTQIAYEINVDINVVKTLRDTAVVVGTVGMIFLAGYLALNGMPSEELETIKLYIQNL